MSIDHAQRHTGPGGVPHDINLRDRNIASTEWFPVYVPAIEALLIVLTSVVSGIAYHMSVYGVAGQVSDFATLGALAAFWLTLVSAFKSEYAVEKFLAGGRGFYSLFNVWTSVFIALLLIGFLTKTSDMVSRGWLIMFYLAGMLTVSVFDFVLHRIVSSAARKGRLQAHRLMLVGTSAAIDRFLAAADRARDGIAIAAIKVLPSTAELQAMSDKALCALLRSEIDKVRTARISDVVIVVEPGFDEVVGRIVEGLMDLPATIHLGGQGLLEKFPQIRAERVGRLRTFSLIRAPMTFTEKLLKRSLDVTLASIALIGVTPLFLVVALLIKRDSPGPVFFKQRRRGYNQVEFKIYKFRSMTTMDDGDTVVQASRHDSRITRLGSFLRRSNIDELPQLINVIRGEMSLVGPRPHAVAHDIHYGQMIERYARRLNVKPGITGWAQVNGLRGPTEHEATMRARVNHDLYYIDNWSIALDLRILVETVVSRRAYRNAV